jgi:hypothetical protein
LGALTEYDTDTSGVGDAFFPRHTSFDLTPTGIRDQNAGQDFHGRRFPGAVGPDIPHQFTLIKLK